MVPKDVAQYWVNRIAYWALLATYLILLTAYGVGLSMNLNATVVPPEPKLGLPRYVGSCATLVRIIYQGLEQNREITSKLHTDPNRNKLIFKSKVIGSIANAFTYASSCDDVNAIGLMLVSDANITLDAAFNQIISFNEAVPLARSYFDQANKLGYFKTHFIQGYLLTERIERNAFRVTIKAPF